MSKKLLIPLAVFVVLVGFLLVGLWRDPREVPSPLIGKPAPAVHARAAARAREDARSRPISRVRSGCSTSGHRGAYRAATSIRCWSSSARAKIVPIVGLNYKDETAAGQALARARTATRTPCRSSIATVASASTGASTACPRRSSIDKAGTIRYKQIGPITVGGAAERRSCRSSASCRSRRARRRWPHACMRDRLAHRAASRAHAACCRRRRGRPTEKDAVAAARVGEALREAALPRLPEPDRSRIPTPELAQDLRRQIREQIAAGKTDDEIVDYMVARYGDFVLYQPPVKPTTCAALGGTGAARSSSGSPVSRAPVRARRAEPEAPALTAEERERVARLLARRRREGRSRDRRSCSSPSAMVAIALAWVLVPLLRRARPPGIAREASNVAILRDQLARARRRPRRRRDAARALRAGEARARAAAHSRSRSDATGRAPRPTQSAAWTAAILAGAIPIAALVLYVMLGNHEAFAPGARARSAQEGAEHEVTRERDRRRWPTSSRRELAERTRQRRRLGRCSRAPTTRSTATPTPSRAFERADRRSFPTTPISSPTTPTRSARPRAASAASRRSSSSARSRPIRRTGRRWRSPAPRRSSARTTSARSPTGSG